MNRARDIVHRAGIFAEDDLVLFPAVHRVGVLPDLRVRSKH